MGVQAVEQTLLALSFRPRGQQREKGLSQDRLRFRCGSDVLCSEHELLISSALRAQPALLMEITGGAKGQVHLLLLEHKSQGEKS